MIHRPQEIALVSPRPPEEIAMLPYGKQTIEQDDIAAVVDALQSDWLTTGPRVDEFESSFADATSTQHAVAVSSGTAALHTAMHAAGIGTTASEEVIVPAITFVATANAAVYLGAKPVFADVEAGTLLIDPEDVRRKITPSTRAIVAVDYAGQPCDYRALREIADEHDLVLISDACHSLGASLANKPVGSLADFTCFSLHPIKQITAGEGGMIVTNDSLAAIKMKSFRSHGIKTDNRAREKLVQHQYSMSSLGFNYRLTDIQCALGLSQLAKLGRFTGRRNEVAQLYRQLLEPLPFVRPLTTRAGLEHAYHLFVVRWDSQSCGVTRDKAFQILRANAIGVNVHYQPVYQHPFYRQTFGDQDGCCPIAEQAYSEILSLPIFPDITEGNVHRVVDELSKIGDHSISHHSISDHSISDHSISDHSSNQIRKAA
jgi:perosamine synthetase